MIKLYSNKYRILLVGLFVSIPIIGVLAQGRLILNNGGFVKIAQGAYLVIANSAANAITRNSSGHVISEGETNIVKWNIGTTAASYVIPWGYGTVNYIPISFTTASAAGGSGSINFSTYHTNWNNSGQLPAGILTFTNASGADDSNYVLDRFWQINAQGYTTKPTLTNLLFTYLDVEHSVAGNSIAENNLKAQRYNSNSNQWGDYAPAGTLNAASNTVTIASVATTNLFQWWTLVDLAKALPIELISFLATPTGQTVKVDWATATEINNDYFTIQRSANGMEFEAIAKVDAALPDKIIQKYSHVDLNPLSGRSYYRLMQTDLDGAYSISNIRKVEMGNEAIVLISVFPNPTINKEFSLNFNHSLEDPAVVTVYDLYGKMVYNATVGQGVRTYNVKLDSAPKGVYMVKTVGSKLSAQQKIVLE